MVSLKNNDIKIKLINFGLARSYDEALKGQKLVPYTRNQKPQSFDINEVGEILQTPGYAPPEILLQVSCSPASDLWSVGVTVAELILGKPLYGTSTHGKGVYAQLAAIWAFLGEKSYPYRGFVYHSPVVRDYFQTAFRKRVYLPTKEKIEGSDWILREPEDLCEKFAEDAARAKALAPKMEVANIDEISPYPLSLCNLLKQILLFDPEKRISLEKALVHPFFFVPSSVSLSQENMPAILEIFP